MKMLEFESKVCPTFFWRAFNLRGRLVGQNEVQLTEHDLNFFLVLNVSGHDQLATIRGEPMDVDHLDGFELFQDGEGCQPRGFQLGSLLELLDPSKCQKIRGFPCRRGAKIHVFTVE